MAILDTLRTGYAASFSEPPRIGTQIRYWGGAVATLIAVDPYVRVNGSNSFLLRWRMDDGRIGVTGLRSKAMTWKDAA